MPHSVALINCTTCAHGREGEGKLHDLLGRVEGEVRAFGEGEGRALPANFACARLRPSRREGADGHGGVECAEKCTSAPMEPNLLFAANGGTADTCLNHGTLVRCG